MSHSLLTAPMAALALSLSVAGHADAATILPYSDPVMGCKMILSGQIIEGDSEKLEEFLSANPDISEGRLCLNSPGGSFLEATRLIAVIRQQSFFGTAIAAGHTCESACAIVFMAAGMNAGGSGRINPLMHPQSQLGFHSPSIAISDSQYSQREVTQAWNVALQAISELVRQRLPGPRYTAASYFFPDQLLIDMLATPPDEMFYIDTVQKAAILDIYVFPSGFNSSYAEDGLKNLCDLLHLRMPYYQTDYMTRNRESPMIIERSADAFVAYFEKWNDSDSVTIDNPSCHIEIKDDVDRGRIFDGQADWPLVHLKFFSNEIGDHARVQLDTLPFMSFDPETRLEDLPLDIVGTWQEFLMAVQSIDESASPVFDTCWLTSSTAGITNVNEYVNLRRQPDFSAPIVRRAPLGETVRLVQANSMWFIEAQPGRELCFEACQAFEANPQDTTAAGRVRQCIDDNRLWYEISDTRGNRGWVSRKFLEEVE